MEKIIFRPFLNLQTLNSYHSFRHNDNIFTQGVSGEMSKLILILSYFSLSYIWHDQCCTMSWLPPPASVSQLMMSWDELATAMIAVIVSTLTNCRAHTAPVSSSQDHIGRFSSILQYCPHISWIPFEPNCWEKYLLFNKNLPLTFIILQLVIIKQLDHIIDCRCPCPNLIFYDIYILPSILHSTYVTVTCKGISHWAFLSP